MGRVGEGGISEGQLRFRWFGHVQRRDSGYVGGEAGRQGEKKKATEMVYGWNQGGQKDGRCEMMHYGDPQREQPRRETCFVSNCGENYTNRVPLNVLKSSSTMTYGVKAN